MFNPPNAMQTSKPIDVVLVDRHDAVLGTMEKMEAHEKGLLHRAISILLYDSEGRMLVQQRARSKYHWPLIWSNAVCSHPRLDESYADAAARRLREELGIDTPLEELFHFIYKATDPETGLTEHELDHVFAGTWDGDVPFNPTEVEAVRWMTMDALDDDLRTRPDDYSFWFKVIFQRLQNEKDVPTIK